MRKEISFLKKDTIEQFDGANWKLYGTNSWNLLLTSSGEALINSNERLFYNLSTYKQELEQNILHGDERRYYRNGGNSDIFTLGNLPVVVKECSTSHSALFSINRMDILYTIANKYLPKHVRVPEHYGVLFFRNKLLQLIFMQKVNDGLTVEGMFNNDNIDEKTKLLAIEEMSKAGELIKLISKQYYDNANLLTDYHEGNVIVDFNSPVNNIPFTLWIIDQ